MLQRIDAIAIADIAIIHEDLRYGHAATRHADHSMTQLGIARHVDFLKCNALLLEQSFGLNTIGTDRGRIDRDFSHALRETRVWAYSYIAGKRSYNARQRERIDLCRPAPLERTRASLERGACGEH